MFFFQAEDGIRDLVRSRGLGDVYKRQVGEIGIDLYWDKTFVKQQEEVFEKQIQWASELNLVSYTHLTLPTSDLV